jgi:hypothetical protein
MSYSRDHDRVQYKLFLNQYVDERLERGVTSNVSPTGMYVHRAVKRHHGRSTRYVQLEFNLPGTSEIIWARGEVRRDELELPPWRRPSELVHGTGVKLLDMPRAHQKMWRDFVHEHKVRRVKEILELIRRNRHH